jgi:hypothetical protein
LLAIREGQVSGPVSNQAPGDSAREPMSVFILDHQEILRRETRGMLEAGLRGE